MKPDPNFVIVCRAGFVPDVKGPFPPGKWTEDTLRDLAALHPDAYLMVMTSPDYPSVYSGVEWIDMFGDKRRGRLAAG